MKNNYSTGESEISAPLHIQGRVRTSHLTLNGSAIKTVEDSFYLVGIGKELEHSLIQRGEHEIQVLGKRNEARP